MHRSGRKYYKFRNLSEISSGITITAHNKYLLNTDFKCTVIKKKNQVF